MPTGPKRKLPRVSSEPATMGAMTTEITPTEEQLQARKLFQIGFQTRTPLAIEAGAGAGKTSTLMLLADWATEEGLWGAYFAFNKSIVTDTAAKAKARKVNLRVSTIHSAAFKSYGYQFKGRLDTSARMRSKDIAQMLGIRALTVNYHGEQKYLSQGYLASVVMRAISRFCQSADRLPTEAHFPYVDGIDDVDPDTGKHGWANQNKVRTALLPALDRAWADICDPAGKLPYKHEHYLKGWELSGPSIDVDYILFDEAQDVSPVMASIIDQQDCMKVYVGDSAQSIYEWTGAVDALAKVIAAGANRCTLSTSFRFGPEVAEVANRCLAQLPGNALSLTGGGLAGTVGAIAEPDVFLCRTNARAVERYLHEIEGNRKAHIVGGGSEVVSFARAAIDLRDKGFTSHPELSCFKSWEEVVEYVEEDEQGGELRLMVSLIRTFGAETLLRALNHMPAEADADVIISTAHKAKGREWGAVVLADDFPTGTEEKPLSPAEWKLLYVAVTRAQLALDITRCPHIGGIPTETLEEDL